MYPAQYRSKVKYIAKVRDEQCDQPKEISEPIKEKVRNDVPTAKIDIVEGATVSENRQQSPELKTDGTISIPDEETPETHVLFEIELATKDGVKKIEVKLNDSSAEVASRLAEENKLSKQVEYAIEYKIRKAIKRIKEGI